MITSFILRHNVDNPILIHTLTLSPSSFLFLPPFHSLALSLSLSLSLSLFLIISFSVCPSQIKYQYKSHYILSRCDQANYPCCGFNQCCNCRRVCNRGLQNRIQVPSPGEIIRKQSRLTWIRGQFHNISLY